MTTILMECNDKGNYKPVCFLENFKGDLDFQEKIWVYTDHYNELEMTRFTTRELDLPNWMNEEYYLKNYISLSFMRAIFFYSSNQLLQVSDLNQVQVNNLITLPENWQYFYGWLYQKINKAKKQNSFLTSIYNQFNNWLNEEKNKYKLPLSQNQFNAATQYCPTYKVKGIVDREYYDNNTY